MRKGKLLTTKELAERWVGLVAKGTIENWRQKGYGPKYHKLGLNKTCKIVYKLKDIKEFEKKYFKGGIKACLRLL